MGGATFRIRLTNAFGARPVTISAAHAALRAKDAAIVPHSDRAVTFGGKASITIPPGVELMSDPFNLNAPNLAHFAVTLYVEADSGPTTHTALAFHAITYIAATPGDSAAAKDLDGATLSSGYYWLSGIDVLTHDKNAATVVVMGDSIADASGSADEDQDWPSLLAARFLQDRRTRKLAIANVGISGNRVLKDGAGTSGLSRFERNVLAQPNVRWLVLLEGINDIGSGTTDADQLIQAYQQIIEKARAHQIGVIGCTLLPFKGAFYFSEEGEKVRQAVNTWVRTSGEFDAVADFDAAVRDPADPQKMREDMHRGDYLHPNIAGYEAISRVFDLSMFSNAPKCN
jgi:lysophospholipase L1-like esterase